MVIRQLLGSQLRRNMASGVAITFVSLAVTAVSYPLYLHYLGYEKYGVWLVISTVLTFAQLGNLGLNSAIAKVVAEAYGNDDIEGVRRYIAMALGLLLVSGTLGLAGITLFKGEIVAAFKLSQENALLVSWLLPYLGMLSLYVFIVEAFNSVLSGLGRMDLANSAQATGRVVVLGTSAFLLYRGYGVKSLLWGSTLSYLAINLQTFFHVRRLLGGTVLAVASWDRAAFKKLMQMGSAVFSISLITMLFDPFNKLMLSRYIGVSAIPVYDVAFRGAMQVRGVIESALRAIMPEVSRLSARKDAPAAERVASINRRSMQLILSSGVCLFLPLYLLSGVLLKLWLRHNFVPELTFAFRMVLLSVLVSLLAVPSYYTLLGMGKARQVLTSHILLSFINVATVLGAVHFGPVVLGNAIYLAILLANCASTIYLIRTRRKELALLTKEVVDAGETGSEAQTGEGPGEGNDMGKMTQGKVSIVTVVYNAVGDLEQTLLSVLGQSYRNIEYIIVDGGSTDGTVEIIRKYDDRLARWVSERDGGIYDAMNKGIAMATGEYVGILNAGDWYEPDAVRRVVETFQKGAADVVYGKLNFIDSATGIGEIRQPNLELLRVSAGYVGHPTVFVRRSVYDTARFDTSYRIAADYDLLLNLYCAGRRFVECPALITNMRSGGASSGFATIGEVLRVHRKYFGVTYAARLFAVSAARWAYTGARKRLLEALLPAPLYAAARKRWVGYRVARHG